jgi:redox-sensitive bicupin YhaK (pirin superfamily)
VINEDRVAPGTGFAPHGHQDMEIITYVLSGAVHHQDSTGGEGLLRHGEVQVMSAGSGLRHSEKNPSSTEPLHLLQIWIVPDQLGVTPRYGQKQLDQAALRAGFSKIFAPASEAALFPIHQDARLFIAWPGSGQMLEHAMDAARCYYLHVATGAVTLGEFSLKAGDAAMLEHEAALSLVATADSQLLLFDLRA